MAQTALYVRPYEQVTRAVSAGSRRPEEEAAAAAASSKEAALDARAARSNNGGGASTSSLADDGFARIGGPGNRVRFAARGRGVRGPMFEGSVEVGPCRFTLL